MKTDTVYKRAFNQMLELVSAVPAGSAIPSENDLSSRMAVSRTTVRKVLRQLEQRRIVDAYRQTEGRARKRVRVAGERCVKGRRAADPHEYRIAPAAAVGAAPRHDVLGAPRGGRHRIGAVGTGEPVGRRPSVALPPRRPQPDSPSRADRHIAPRVDVRPFEHAHRHRVAPGAPIVAPGGEMIGGGGRR